MNHMQQIPHFLQQPTHGRRSPQRRPRVRDSFRVEWLLIPMVLLCVLWILTGVDGASVSFDDVMDWLRVKNRGQYRQLATLGCIAVAIVWIVRVLKEKDPKD